VYLILLFDVIFAESFRGSIVASGALPALVSLLASSTSEATKEQCAISIRNISITGAVVALETSFDVT
jgi:hypothetical protein